MPVCRGWTIQTGYGHWWEHPVTSMPLNVIGLERMWNDYHLLPQQRLIIVSDVDCPAELVPKGAEIQSSGPLTRPLSNFSMWIPIPWLIFHLLSQNQCTPFPNLISSNAQSFIVRDFGSPLPFSCYLSDFYACQLIHLSRRSFQTCFLRHQVILVLIPLSLSYVIVYRCPAKVFKTSQIPL